MGPPYTANAALAEAMAGNAVAISERRLSVSVSSVKEYARVLYDFGAENDDELTVREVCR